MITLFSRIPNLENTALAKQSIHTCSDTDTHINNTNINCIQMICHQKNVLQLSYLMAYPISNYV